MFEDFRTSGRGDRKQNHAKNRSRRRAHEGAIVGMLEALEPRNLMSVSINLFAGNLYKADGTTPLPLNSTVVLLADADGDGFGDLTTANANFTVDAGDVVLDHVLATNDALGDGTGSLLTQVTISSVPGSLVGKQMLLVWYDKLFDAAATGPGAGVQFRTFRTDAVIDSSDIAWVFPADGSTVSLNFLTGANGGTNPESAGATTQVTAGGSSNQAPILNAIGNKSVNELANLAFTATASDPDAGSSLTFSLDAASINAGMSINPTTGAFSFTPTEEQGPGTFTTIITVADSGSPSLTDSETITITVGEVNVAPVLATIGNKTVNELTNLTFTATATDTDVPANGLTFTLDAASIAAGMTIDPATGVFNWTPSAAQGPGSFTTTITVTDNGNPALSDSENITITVNEVNVAPVLAIIGDKAVNELAALTFTASATDSNVLTFTLDATSIANGMTINPTTGAFSWTPTEAQGPGTFTTTITVTDNGNPALSDSETITITVGEVNAAPVLALIGDKNVAELASLTFTASATDTDQPANTRTFSLDANSIAAGMTINAATGAFSWTPTEAQGPGSFTTTITVTDNGNPVLSDSETITITVSEVNIAPVLASIGGKSVNEGQTLTVNLSATDEDAPANTILLSATGLPAFATFTDNGNGTGKIDFAPGFSNSGTFNITVTATDNGNPARTDSETFTLTVVNVNRAPDLSAIANQSVNEGESLTVNLTATDADGNAIGLSATGLPAFATFTDNGNGTGTIQFNPAIGTTGSFNISVTATDNGNPILSDTESFTLSVGDVNRAPVLAPIGNQSVNEGQTLTINLSATDPDADNLVLSVTGLPAFATFTDNGNGTGSIQFAPGFADAGTFNLSVTATDNGDPIFNDTESFTLTVVNVNRAPSLAPISNQLVDEGQSLTVNFSATDPDGNAIALSATGLPAFATFTDNGNGTGKIVFAPGFSDAGSFDISITATDNGNPALGDTESFNLLVEDVNRAPVLATIGSQSALEGQTLTINLSAVDPDGNPLTLTATGLPAFATLTDNGNGSGTISINAPSGSAGTFNITVFAAESGEGALSDSETFTLSIGDVNGPPDLAGIANQSVNEGQALTINLSSTDPDGNTITLTATGLPSFATLTDNGDGTGTIQFAPGFANAGSFNISVTAADNGAPSLSDTESFTLTVNNINRAPDLAAIAGQSVNEGQSITVNLSATDPDSDPITLSATSLPSFVTFTDNGNGTGTIQFAPGFSNAGTFNINVTASDNGSPALSDTESFTLTVADINRAPDVTPITNKVVIEGQSLTVNLTAADADGNTIVLSVTGLPAFASFIDNGNGTGSISFNPALGTIGTFNLSVTATDNGNPTLTDSESFTLTVAAAQQVTGAFVISDSIDSLASLNPTTGQLTVIGELRSAGGTLFGDIEAIAFDRATGLLFGVQENSDDTSTLVTINTTTAVVTVIGIINAIDVDALTFDPATGNLWGVDDTIEPLTQPTDPGRLIRIDKTSGAILQAVELIKPTADPLDALKGFDPGIDGIAFNPVTGDLIAVYSAWGQIIYDSTGRPVNVLPGIPSFLVDIDLITGQMSVIGNTGVKDIEEIAFDSSGVLHGVLGDTGDLNPTIPGTFPGSFEGLVSLNTTTAASAVVGSFGPAPVRPSPDLNRWDVEALAFVFTTPTVPDVGSRLANVSIQAVDADASENGDTATYQLVRTGSTSEELVVNLSRSGSATYGTRGDYLLEGEGLNAKATTIVIPAGRSSALITLVPQDDNKAEKPKQASLSIRRGGSYSVDNSTRTADAVVADNEVRQLSINDVTVVEGNSGTRTATFTVKLSSASVETITVNVATSNGTALAGADYTALATTTLTFAPGETSKQVTVEIIGDVTDEYDQTFFVNLSNAVNAAIADNRGVGTIHDNDQAPTIRIDNVEVTEGGNANFTLSLSSPTEKTVTVNASTSHAGSSGTRATGGVDFTSLASTMFTFSPGQTSIPVTINTLFDEVGEANEFFAVNLRSTLNARIADGQGIGTIIDLDAPTVSISDAQVDEPEAGLANLSFDVSLSNPSTIPVTVKFTAPASSSQGSAGLFDIKPVFIAIVTFNPGETSKPVAIEVKSDSLDEDNETVNVTLLSTSVGTIADGTGVGTIIDTDAVPTVTVSDVSLVEGNSGTKNAVFTVKLSERSGRPVSVDVQTANNTATAGDDFTALLLTTLTFAPGQTEKRVTVPVTGDVLTEDTESFFLNLTNAVNAIIADNQGLGTITSDELSINAIQR